MLFILHTCFLDLWFGVMTQICFFVILVYYYSLGLMGKEVYMHAGHVGTNTNRQRYIPVHIISDKLGKNVCKCLPAAHALTGCDTTSGIFRIGKCTAYTKLLQNNLELTPLGSFANLAQNEAETVACKYAFLLYGVKKRKMEPSVQNKMNCGLYLHPKQISQPHLFLPLMMPLHNMSSVQDSKR